MAIEDFTTYAEVDPNSRIGVTTRRVTWTDLSRNEDAYIYSDKGANYFDGDFLHLLTFKLTANNGISITHALWMVADAVDSYNGIWGAGKNALSLDFYYSSGQLKLYLNENVNTSNIQSSPYVISLDTPYYLKIVRDESVGTYGTLYCYIYSDEGRTTLLDTLSLTLTITNDFQYMYVINTFNGGTAHDTSGYIANLELFGGTPVVTAQSATAFTATAVTGNGTIVDLGSSAVTEHGYCWDNTVDPTTTDSSSGFWGKTTQGDGSLGTFTSSVTGLSVGQQYYMRPYAVNGTGTAYGANVSFIAGERGLQLIKGNLAIVETRIHYAGTDGKEYWLQGTLA